MRHETRVWGGRPTSRAVREHSDSRQRTAAFLRLLGLHDRQINGYILSLVPNWADADEVAQETKVRLWEQFDSFDPSRDFGAWACTVAHYQVLSYRKRVGRERAQFSDAFLDAVADEASRSARELEGRHQAMENCLKKLDERKATLLRRCYAGVETIKQVAERTGLSLEAARKELQRIRRVLAHCIQKSLDTEGNA